jgi:hypothetical protein
LNLSAAAMTLDPRLYCYAGKKTTLGVHDNINPSKKPLKSSNVALFASGMLNATLKQFN